MENITVDSVYNSIVAGSITEDEARYLNRPYHNTADFDELSNRLQKEAGITRPQVAALILHWERKWKSQ